jgi:hypothetical protein
MKPFMRNAMLVRAQHMTIEGNKLDGTHGGVMGINFTTSMGESARLRDINISHNTIAGFQSAGIIVGNAYRDPQGLLDARDFAITNNIFQVGPAKTIRIRGVQNLSLKGNRFEKDGKAVEPTTRGVEIADCMDVQPKDE